MKRLLVALSLLASPALAQAPAPSPPDTWLPRTTAELLVLDKVRAQPTTLTLRTGQSAKAGTLTITLRGCATRPPDLPQDSAAFLDVVDSRNAGAGFRGWMLANAPALSQLEHPIYDLRLVACR